jgi:hypothetical protein
MDPNNCAICNWQRSEVSMQNSGVMDGLLIECPLCGKYELAGKAISDSYTWENGLRNALSCAARQASERGQRIQITGTNATELAQPHMNTRVSDNQERLLREIARRAVRPQETVWLALNRDFTLIDCYSKEEFVWHLEWLKREELIYSADIGMTNQAKVRMSMKGWRQAQPVATTGGLPGQCFVAMWFSDETRTAYEHGIEPAIKDAGFRPMRIDRKEHNNEIPDEILAEIRNSEFMVADFTGQRAGVYYEAGFAMGLGRKVIWCCRQDEIDRLHFDTNHRNHIGWQAPQELRERLYARIRATILEQR